MVTPRQLRTHFVRTMCLTVFTITASLLVACGAQSAGQPQGVASSALTREQYQQAIDTIVSGEDTREASRLFTEAVATSHGKAACEERVRGLYQRLSAVVRAVEDVQAPADAQNAHDDFLEGARESVRLVGMAADDVGKGALQCGQPLNKRIYALPSTMRAERAIDEIERLGYRVFGE